MSVATSATGGRLERPGAVVEAGLEAARDGDTVVIVTERSEAEVRFACNTVTTNGTRSDRRVAVVRMVPGPGGRQVGAASRSGAVDITSVLAAAEHDAADAPPAEDAADLLSGPVDPEFGEPGERTTTALLARVLAGLGDAFARARSEGNVLAGFAEHSVATIYLGTSSGIRRRYVLPTGKLQLVARSGDGARSVWAGAGTRDFSDVDLESLEERLRRRMAWAGRSVELPPGRYETILPADAVADLVALAYDAAGGRDAEDGRTVFSAPGGRTKLGERLSDLPFCLRSDPDEPGLECTPFLATAASGTDVSVFDNGAPLDRTQWIADGKLAALRYHRAGAARSNQPFRAPIDNCILEVPGADASVDDLVAHTERGLLVTCLWYIREVDPATLLLTGLTRDGVYLVEGGEITAAVNNFRFNESPIDVMARTIEAGRTQRALSREWNEYFPRTAMAPLRVADFNMSSVSPAT